MVSQLAVNPDAVAAAAQGNMQDFVKALEKGESSPKETSGSADKAKDGKTDKKSEDDDEQMQLD